LSHYSSKKRGEGQEEGALIRGGQGAYFKSWVIPGALTRRGRLFEGGVNSRIYGIASKSIRPPPPYFGQKMKKSRKEEKPAGQAKQNRSPRTPPLSLMSGSATGIAYLMPLLSI